MGVFFLNGWILGGSQHIDVVHDVSLQHQQYLCKIDGDSVEHEEGVVDDEDNRVELSATTATFSCLNYTIIDSIRLMA